MLEKENNLWKRSEKEDPDGRELARPASNARQGCNDDGNHGYPNV